MMKITGLSHLFKWENLHNWWLTKYFFAPLYLAGDYFQALCNSIAPAAPMVWQQSSLINWKYRPRKS